MDPLTLLAIGGAALVLFGASKRAEASTTVPDSPPPSLPEATPLPADQAALGIAQILGAPTEVQNVISAAASGPVGAAAFLLDAFTPDPTVPIPMEVFNGVVLPYVASGMADARISEWKSAPDRLIGYPSKRTVELVIIHEALVNAGFVSSGAYWKIDASHHAMLVSSIQARLDTYGGEMLLLDNTL